MSSGTRRDPPPWRGPFREPPSVILAQLERSRDKDVLEEDDVVYFDQMDLSSVDLAGEFLTGGLLFEANLSGARLDGASLRRARADGLILRGASCCGTDFFKASLEGADFADVLGRFAYFCRADVTNATFDGASLFHASFADAVCLRTSFVRADLQGADLTDAMLTEANMQEARLWGANLDGVSMDSRTLLAGATGIEHIRVTSLRFEGEELMGDTAKELLVSLARPRMVG